MKKVYFPGFWVVFFMFFLSGGAFGARQPGFENSPASGIRSSNLSSEQELRKGFSKVRLPFIENKGQVDGEVRFYAKTFGGTVFVTERGEIVYSLPLGDDSKNQRVRGKKDRIHDSRGVSLDTLRSSGDAERVGRGIVLRETLMGGRVNPPKGEHPSVTKVSYFKGDDPSRWQSDISTYEVVDFGEVYEGIDLRLKAYGNNVEKLFYVKPGADADFIKVRIEGAKGLSINDKGELEAETELGKVRFTKPVAYQEIGGKRVEVRVEYKIEASEETSRMNKPSPPVGEGQGEGKISHLIYAFRVGDYDKTRELIIDPLLASTFVGGDNDDIVSGIVVGSSGNIYITGRTLPSSSTPPVNFPVTSGAYDETHNSTGYWDCFISKLSPDLSALLSSTFLGGNGNDYCNAIKLDQAGNVFVAGFTSSSNFPTTSNAYQRTYERGDAFIAKMNSSLSGLLSATYFRPSEAYWSNEEFLALAIDSSGNVYAAGISNNSGTLPQGGYKTSRSKSNQDALIVKMSNDLSTLLGATFLGGDNVREKAVGIAIDSSGNVFVTGDTEYYTEGGIYKNDFPVTPGAYNTTYGTDSTGCIPSYIAKFNSNLSNLLAATYVGGPGTSWCGTSTSFGYTYTKGIAIDGSDNIFVAGGTDTDRFPTTDGAYDRTYGSGNEAFVSKFNSSLSSLLASTYIGGSGTGGYGHDYVYTLALDRKGNVYIAGTTSSTDYPTTLGAHDTTLGPPVNWDHRFDGFVSKLDGNLTRLIYSSYLGGGYIDEIFCLAVDSSERMIVTGRTFTGYTPSIFSNFPVTSNAYDITPNGWYDVFISILKEPQGLVVDVIGPGNVSPGAESTFVIRYMNKLGRAAEDVVLVSNFPREYRYLLSTGNGIYSNSTDSQQVFWRLGNLQQDDEGVVSVKVEIPWGLPAREVEVFANIAAKNAPNPNLDISKYLDYSGRRMVSQNELSIAQINTLLSQNVQIQSLLNYAVAKGYMFFSQGLETNYDDGLRLITFFLLGPRGDNPALLVYDGQNALIHEYDDEVRTVFDEAGGYRHNSNTGSFSSWGEWAVPSSLTEALCQFNCTQLKVPDWVLKEVNETYKEIKKIKSCVSCAITRDKYDCAKCANVFLQRYKKIPGVSQTIDVVKCLEECLNNPNKYVCTEDKRECSTSLFGWLGGFDTVVIRQCNKVTGTFDPVLRYINCAYGDVCINGRCGPHPCRNNPQCNSKKQNITPAHDPNAKSVNIQGNVLPGQRLTYTVEYENVGAGTAYEVFILDQLDTNLDESTLVINDGGTFSLSGRLLSWEIGTLPPCTPAQPDVCKGSVSFSVNVKNGLPSGTEIINYAEVHFPSANEITLTNPVLSIVKAIAADPKSVETVSETPVVITLSGRDTGANPLTYRITTHPVYGELSGVPPNITYTSMEAFSGQDEFYYVVQNGLIESDPARVVIKVSPNPSDITPPEVISTYPKDQANHVRVNLVPFSTDPVSYLPVISATFSEPIDATTVTPSTFIVSGLSGTVHYDERLRTAYFTLAVPLNHSTTYTATLTTGIKDKMGNPMGSDFSWEFTTESPQNISVSLPDNAEEIQFAGQSVNSTSSYKIVNVTNTGTMNLTIGVITMTGADGSQFLILQDHCSGTTLSQSQNCLVKVAFRPASSGLKRATLTIPSDDPDTPEFRIAVSGVGVILQYTLTVTKAGTGGGTVTSSPPGITCGSDCSEPYNDNTVVTLTATPASNSVFAGWSGDCSGTNPSVQVTMNANKTCTATFTQMANFIALVSPSEGAEFNACSYYNLPKFQWNTDQVFKTIEVQFSAQSNFATILKAKASPSLKELQMTTAVWKKVLLLPGVNGGVVYWRVVGTKADKTVVVSNVRSFTIEAAEAVAGGVISPTSILALPTLSWSNNCAVKFKVWFGNDPDFTKAGMKKRALAFNIANPNDNAGVFTRQLTSGQWVSIHKLVGSVPGSTIYWYVESWDVVKRYQKTGVMSFVLTP